MFFELEKFAQRQGLLHYPFDKPYSSVKEEQPPTPVGKDEEGQPLYSCKDCGKSVSEDNIGFWDKKYDNRKYYQNIDLTPEEVAEFVNAIKDIADIYLAETGKEIPNIENLKNTISSKLKALPHVAKIDNLIINMMGRNMWNSSYLHLEKYLQKFLETGNVDDLHQAFPINLKVIEQELLRDIRAASKFETALNVKSPVCEECAENYSKCDSCEEYIPDGEDKYNTIGGDTICQKCLDNGGYSSCNSCGWLDHDDNMRYVEQDGSMYCEDCFSKLQVEYGDFEDEIEKAAQKNPYPFKQWFPDGNRLYMDFIPDFTPDENDVKIMDFLSSVGCQISNTEYQKGYCEYKGRTFKIGKFLEKIKSDRKRKIQSKNTIREPEFLNKKLQELDMFFGMMLKQFVDSPSRRSAKKSNLKIVISQDPDDIGRMSTGRDWTSCMQLGIGGHSLDVFCEIKAGALIAYLIEEDDKEIEHPLARISIKRFTNKAGQSLALPEKTIYGNAPSDFVRQVRNWLESRQKDLPKGEYERQGGSYSDSYGHQYTKAFNQICSLLKTACGNSGWYTLSKDALTLMRFLK